MNIIVAKHAGFCFGVRRAVNVAVETSKEYKGKKIFTLGPLIHNPQVIAELAGKGIRNCTRMSDIKKDIVIIPSHGIHPEELEKLQNKNVKIIDATCPFVKKIERIVTQERKKGSYIIIVGDKEHPEVRAISGYAGQRAKVIESGEEARKLRRRKKICVVAQTTQAVEKYRQICEVLRDKAVSIRVYNTICDATEKRQKEAVGLAKVADKVIVVGGFNSANTKRLVKICEEIGSLTLHVEEPQQVSVDFLRPGENVCVLAGASTPDWIIQKVVGKLNLLKRGFSTHSKCLK